MTKYSLGLFWPMMTMVFYMIGFSLYAFSVRARAVKETVSYTHLTLPTKA